MGAKRKAAGPQNGSHTRPEKKSRQDEGKHKASLVFEPRPDWHTFELPPLDLKEVRTIPPRNALDNLQEYANSLLEKEAAAYNASHMTGSSSHKFLSTIMSSGTLEDKVSALTLLVQESPLHTMKAFENLVGLARKKSRNRALMAMAALKDLLGQGVVLPERKLRAFGKQPGVLGALQGKTVRWSANDSLPAGIQKVHLVVWAFEDWLKRTYFELLQVLESWCNDEVEYARSRAITYVWELLKAKPEQEENLLRLLVNKLGDTERKIASRASYLLLQLENTHPAMKLIVTNSIEADCLFRPGQNVHAKYYAVITLNQTVLSAKEQGVADRLLDIYFDLFVQYLKPRTGKTQMTASTAKPGQGGGGKAGKMAMKKQRAEEQAIEAEGQLREKLIAQVLTGVNRAFPFADTNNPRFEQQMDTIFRVTHSSNFNTIVQALLLIQQISTTKHYGAERFYRTLYQSLLDPRLLTSSKQVMYLNLLYKSLKADLNAKRVQAFVKRLLQTINLHEPPFVCGVLYLISELETAFPSIRNMMTEPEALDEDEEEHFADVPEDVAAVSASANITAFTPKEQYDPKKRDPEHARAERSCLWDILPLLQHFHPSVCIFAEALLYQKEMPPKPDPTKHTLIHFLDRFVYRNAKSKPVTAHGASIMQPSVGSNAADLLIKPGESALRGAIPVNSEAFWQQKVENVAADEVFFHSYFNQTSNKKRAAPAKRDSRPGAGDDSEDDPEEDEIWEAIAKSKPEVEGPDSDDDLSLGDLESAYSDSDDDSVPGLDLGGDDIGNDVGDADDEPGLDLDDGEADDEDALPELESGDEGAFLDDDDEVPFDLDAEAKEEEEAAAKPKKGDKRKAKKKLKHLPTFASAEDYARLLDAEPDDI